MSLDSLTVGGNEFNSLLTKKVKDKKNKITALSVRFSKNLLGASTDHDVSVLANKRKSHARCSLKGDFFLSQLFFVRQVWIYLGLFK